LHTAKRQRWHIKFNLLLPCSFSNNITFSFKIKAIVFLAASAHFKPPVMAMPSEISRNFDLSLKNVFLGISKPQHRAANRALALLNEEVHKA